jgi:hypothetical protein
MELLSYAAAFYLWECVFWLPPEAFGFLAVAGRSWLLRGGGFRIANPSPFHLTLRAAALPFEVTEDAVYASGPIARFSSEVLPGPTRRVRLHAGLRASASGSLVRLDGCAFVRGSSKDHAERLAVLLAQLARLPRDERVAVALGEVRRSLSRTDALEALSRIDTATRLLRWLASAFFLAVFVAIPASHVLRLAPIAMASAMVAAAILYPLTVVALWRAHGHLFPGATRARRECVVSTALFPPALLRAADGLAGRRLVSLHPAAVGAALLERERLVALFSELLAGLEYPAWRRADDVSSPEGSARKRFLDLTHEAVSELARSCGVDITALRAARRPSTRDADSYCPLCMGEFRAGFTRCEACGLDTVRYAPS